ncbi:MAG: hypothetical protein GF384_06810 [Elusimicrobia bacterium]|nr:hypothetical protein [Elusimicrobiota bacterium]MBD3412411.1 hypothetical protein [Elusimicrobiota bacterium]
MSVATTLKKSRHIIRMNTSGHGNLIHKRNIIPDLHGLVDAISVSLNGETAEKYFILHRPIFGLKTFDAILDFIRESKRYIPRVYMSTIDLPDNWKPGMPGIDVDACRRIAESLQVEFRLRPYLDAYEET